jgi:16S rRNA processing protein RimM
MLHSDTDDLPWPDDAIEVARVIGAWGIKGGIRVAAYAADPQALFSSRRWFLQADPARPRPAGAAPLPRVLRITQAKEHGDGIVATAQELTDRNAAEAMKGVRIFVSRSSFPSTGDDEYYWVDLIGLDVVNRQGEALGRVAELLDTGAHSVLQVVAEAGEGGATERRERLIPFVAAYVDQVSLADRRITVDWGLDY